MITQPDLTARLDFVSEPALRQELLETAKLEVFEPGDVIVREGQYVKVLPIVISGSIRVFHHKEDREILLYYVEPSQTCIMSLSACFFNTQSESEAVAVSTTEVLTVPSQYISQWQAQYPSWNSFIIRTFKKRYDDLLHTFESLAFDHIDKRVIQYLEFRKSKQNNSLVRISHQQLANELGTTRVVISRILKQFELSGKLTIHRGTIELH